MRLPVLQGLLPVERSRVRADALAGLTLAALGVPEVLGYAKIAGMPLVTGLYTMLLPMAVFAVLGSSRHLVVAADSATAAILAAALAGLAVAGSPAYVKLAGLAALLTAGMLLAARLARLAFLANFLSRTVLVGFLTGVGIQVAAGQLPDMLGVSAAGQSTVPRLVRTLRALPQAHWADVAIAAAVIVIVLGLRRIARRLPGSLIAVVAAIAVSKAADLAAHGVTVIGAVPRGLPDLTLAGSPAYVKLAGLAALLTAGMLLAARLARLAFLANFLSRTVLVGFLTGVGIQVAAGQLPDMLGVSAKGQSTVPKLLHTLRALPHVHWADVVISIAVMVIVLGARLINRRIPGALIAVAAAIAVSWAVDLAQHGVAVVGAVPRGLPSLVLPAFGWHAAGALTGVAASMFVVILAQSAATSRAYAAKYEEEFSEATDLVGLGAANAAAAFTGTFVVNGSPTKAQIVDSAGGRSQLSPLTAAAVVLVVLVAAHRAAGRPCR